MLNEDRAIQSPRMRRKLFNLATAISLVLCIAIVALWGRSYWKAEVIQYQSPMGTPPCKLRYLQIYSVHGGLSLRLLRETYPQLKETELASPYWNAHIAGLRRDVGWKYEALSPLQNPRIFIGFDAQHEISSIEPWRRGSVIDYESWVGTIPFWFLMLLTLTPCLILAYRRIRRATRRKAAGLCPTCGYDLRATPERCPECGTAAAAAK